MAQVSNLPCDGDGICMSCKNKPPPEEALTCRTCTTPWHVSCLSSSSGPHNLSDTLQWECPDCCMTNDAPVVAAAGSRGELVAAIRAIEADATLSETEKAKRRQALLSGKQEEEEDGKSNNNGGLTEDLNCAFCMQLLDRPVSTPCGHNFCLKCFQKWIAQGKRICAFCRKHIPPMMASHPRINSTLVIAIRMAKMSKSTSSTGPAKSYHFIHNQNRPDKAYTTERAKKAGKANASSGKIFVTVPSDHLGPILAEHDPERSQGVLVGETWEDRFECRQWGAHLPHLAGIAGQSKYGAQSVALSGGYVDDEDHGEWFLYTGSGGRDLRGNKRTNKEQSSDQKFEKMNEALRLSCRKGYPVRVVRSHKEKRSSYAPQSGVRYDGIYRVEKCWRKNGIQGYKICRYLLVRCDNEPAPWTTEVHGDRPRPLPVVNELEDAIDITERRGTPAWDYDEEKCCWMWKKPPPPTKKGVSSGNPEDVKRKRQDNRQTTAQKKLLKEFGCQICRKVLNNPLTTPCAHNFCKECLEGIFAGQSFTRQRTCQGRRTLRVQKNIMKCPSCTNDIAEYLQNPEVNRKLMDVIESLQREAAEEMKNLEDSGEESDDACEESETRPVTKKCKVDGQISVEAEADVLKNEVCDDAQETWAQEQATAGEDAFEQRKNKMADGKKVPANQENTNKDNSQQMVEAGVRTRTRSKRAKVAVAQ